VKADRSSLTAKGLVIPIPIDKGCRQILVNTWRLLVTDPMPVGVCHTLKVESSHFPGTAFFVPNGILQANATSEPGLWVRVLGEFLVS